MPSARYLSSSYGGGRSTRERAISGALALGLVLLLLWGLIAVGVIPLPEPRRETPLSTFSLSPAPTPARQATAAPHPRAVAVHAHAAPKAVTRTPPPPQQPDTTQTFDKIPGMIVLSKQDYAASDVGKIKGAPVETASNDQGSGRDSDSTAGPGEGPGGQRLYNAEWVREPTHAELATYLPHDLESGWALIACRTIPGDRVEDCQDLDEQPAGAHLARGLRQAAWQFRIRPPRVGGKPMIGSWVRIHFDLVRGIER